MNTITKIALVITSTVVTGLSSIATVRAASFEFSYTLENGSIFSGMLEGTVRADGDVVDVFLDRSINPMFNGNPGPELFVVSRPIPSDVATDPPFFITPQVSFSSSIFYLHACSNKECTTGEEVLLSGRAGFFLPPFYEGSAAYGNTFEDYNPNNWELTRVPEPVTILASLIALSIGISCEQKQNKSID